MDSNKSSKRRIGIYEKALPLGLSVEQLLSYAKSLEFGFLELSIDESDFRLDRLHWTRKERRALRDVMWDLEFPIHSICLSAHRKYPFGSADPNIRTRALEIMEQAVELAVDLGVRIIQLAGYDVYYEEQTPDSHELFVQGMIASNKIAHKSGVTLGVEIMDTAYMNSIFKFLSLAQRVRSSFFKVYPDIGNLTAWNNDVDDNLAAGIADIVAIHLKDTLKVKKDFPGQFRDLVIGEGEVDFVSTFKQLAMLDYAGPFVIEMWSQGDDEFAIKNRLVSAKDFITKAMDDAGYLLS